MNIYNVEDGVLLESVRCGLILLVREYLNAKCAVKYINRIRTGLYM